MRRNKRREFQDNLNLVPFIDLFSTIIIFLLITAVFDQLSSMTVNLGAQSTGSQVAPTDKVKKVTSELKIIVSDKSILLYEGKKARTLGLPPIVEKQLQVGEGYESVDAFLKEMREKYTDKKDIIVEATDNALYDHLVGVMDRCMDNGFEELILTGQG